MTARGTVVGLALVLFGASSLSVGQSSSTLTLGTYNIHVGVPMGEEIGRYKSISADLDKISKVLTEADADVVGLQEVDCEYGLALPERRRSSILNQARYLAAVQECNYIFASTQDDTGYPTDNPGYVEWGNADRLTNNGGVHGEVGNALLTKLALAEPPENIPLPKDPGQERRACIRAKLTVPASDSATTRTIVVYSTHLQHNSEATRYKQMQAILDRIRQEPPGTAVFLVGDLNHEYQAAGEENPIRLAVENGLHDLAAPDPGKEDNLATFPADKPEIRIDFVMANHPVNVLNKQVIPTLASDHLPVFVTVNLGD